MTRYLLNQPWRRNVRDSINSPLSSLKWPTLQLCSESTHIILLYKIVHHTIQISTNYYPIPSPVTTTRSRSNMKFLHYQPTIDCFKHSFLKELSMSGTDCHHILFMPTHETWLKMRYFI